MKITMVGLPGVLCNDTTRRFVRLTICQNLGLDDKEDVVIYFWDHNNENGVELLISDNTSEASSKNITAVASFALGKLYTDNGLPHPEHCSFETITRH